MGNASQENSPLDVLNDLFKVNPDELREILKKDPELGSLFASQHKKALGQLTVTEAHLQVLLPQFLGSVSPNSTFYCIGSGAGSELPFARLFVPDGRIVAIDPTPDLAMQQLSVLFEIISRAEFHPFDLSMMQPEEVINKVGSEPDVVLCRHPSLVINPFWREHLALWGVYMRDRGGKLLVTTYSEMERVWIAESMQGVGLAPRLDTFQASLFSLPWHDKYESDKFVAVLG